jgi:hypothetical protein
VLRLLTQEEIDDGSRRKSFLYTSAFTIDNLTAILMDTNVGSSGLHEETARAKAHNIISWLEIIVGIKIPKHRKSKSE